MWLCGEVLLLGSVFVIKWCFCKHYPNGKWRPHLKRINMFFWLKCLVENLGKKQGKILRNQGKIREYHGIKNWQPWTCISVWKIVKKKKKKKKKSCWCFQKAAKWKLFPRRVKKYSCPFLCQNVTFRSNCKNCYYKLLPLNFERNSIFEVLGFSGLCKRYAKLIRMYPSLKLYYYIRPCPNKTCYRPIGFSSDPLQMFLFKNHAICHILATTFIILF